MDSALLVSTYPVVYHMANADAWESIRVHGLLSTTALLDLFQVSGQRRDTIEGARRPNSVTITHPALGSAVIRDNKPLSERKLLACLDDLSPAEYYRLLNRRVFFWLNQSRLDRLFQAQAYRGLAHLVLSVDTAELVSRHGDRITLSSINSGATIHNPPRRGATTFRTIEDYDFALWKAKRSAQRAIAELAVDYSVPDIKDLTMRAAIRQPDGREEVLWSR